MKEYIKVLLDRKFYIPLLVLIFLEIALQGGCYSPFLKPKSYAANVDRITDYALDHVEQLDPTYLILGTSVAYQGLSVKSLNQAVQPYGESVQSVAVPGSELFVQDLIALKTLPHFRKVHTIIHIFEINLPWVQQDKLSLPTLAMVSELNRIKALQKLEPYEYEYDYSDLAYISVRSIAYRRDFRDFALGPLERIKKLGRKFRKDDSSPFVYENTHYRAISMYAPKDLEECMQKTAPTNADPIPEGSDRFHKQALFDTCQLSTQLSESHEITEPLKKYFRRLKILHQDLYDLGVERIIYVFAPYSELIEHLGGNERMAVWDSQLRANFPEKEHNVWDYRRILDGKANGDYFYDLIHLNHTGMEEFTKSVAQDLVRDARERSKK